MKKLAFVLATAAALVIGNAVAAPPASAVVHEIVAQWCSGHEPLDPAGIAREGSQNFAQPLNAGGVVTVHPFTGSAGPGLLIDFDFTSPQIKIVPTGQFIVIGMTPAGPLYLEGFVPDPNFPAFANCRNF